MTSRVWINKPNDELIELMDQSVDIKLFLVQENGPLSFTFKDEDGDKINVTIGETLRCSCITKSKKNDLKHCVHTIYVLNRLFKLHFSNPLIFQTSMTDLEISQLLESRNNSKVKVKSIKKSIKPGVNSKVDALTNSKKLPLTEDTTCAICQEDMYTEENLYCCSISCGHHYHYRCLAIWAEHKIISYEKVTCPMCRVDWDESVITKENIKALKTANIGKDKVIHQNVNCSNCSRTNIKFERFHCLNCTSKDYCIECFEEINIEAKHDSKHMFIVKKNREEKWIGVDSRFRYGESNTDKQNKPIRYNTINAKLNQFLMMLIENKKPSAADKEAAQLENEDLEVYVVDSKISNSKKSCCVCKSDKASKIHLLSFLDLPCKHSAHYKCMESVFNIENKLNQLQVALTFNRCNTCNATIFPGLSTIGLRIVQEAAEKSIQHLNSKTNNPSNTFNPQMKLEKEKTLKLKSIGSLKPIYLNKGQTSSKAPVFQNFSDMLCIQKIEVQSFNDYESNIKKEQKKLPKAGYTTQRGKNLPPLERNKSISATTAGLKNIKINEMPLTSIVRTADFTKGFSLSPIFK